MMKVMSQFTLHHCAHTHTQQLKEPASGVCARLTAEPWVHHEEGGAVLGPGVCV